MYYTEDEAKNKICPTLPPDKMHGMWRNCRASACMHWMTLEITSQKKGFCVFNIEAIKLIERLENNAKDT